MTCSTESMVCSTRAVKTTIIVKAAVPRRRKCENDSIRPDGCLKFEIN